MTQEALKLALDALEVATTPLAKDRQEVLRAISAIKEALAQTQEPVAYDKTEMNCFVQDLYDKKMQEGKHGHYETMFHVVHQAIKKVPPQRTEQEPVAYYLPHKGFYWAKPTSISAPTIADVEPLPLYTASPQRTWVGLTDDERDHLAGLHLYAVKGQVEAWIEGVDDFARAIEAKLKELNT